MTSKLKAPIRIRTIDAHTAGEPLRIITAGWPELPGDTILAKRAYAKAHHESLRKALMWEPRGHADMYGALLVPPVTPDGDLGVLFMHNEGYSTMCGHGIIALTKVALERNLVTPKNDTVLQIDTPAGRVEAHAEIQSFGGQTRVQQVTFKNVPSFVSVADEVVDVPGLGEVRYTLAFGGAFYAYVEAEALGLSLNPENNQQLIAAGRTIKNAVATTTKISHPTGDSDLGFLYGTVFVGPPGDESNHSRNVCIFADGEVDRSPTGTGVSGRAAIHHARGELETSQWITIESILGSTFDVRVIEECEVGPYSAVIPEVRGNAHITGEHEFLLDPEDPFVDGFFMR